MARRIARPHRVRCCARAMATFCLIHGNWHDGASWQALIESAGRPRSRGRRPRPADRRSPDGLGAARRARAARGRGPRRCACDRRPLGLIRIRSAGRDPARPAAAHIPLSEADPVRSPARRARRLPAGVSVPAAEVRRGERLGARRGDRGDVLAPAQGGGRAARRPPPTNGPARGRVPARRSPGGGHRADLRRRRRALQSRVAAVHGARAARHRTDRDPRRPLPDGRGPDALAEVLDRMAREHGA